MEYDDMFNNDDIQVNILDIVNDFDTTGDILLDCSISSTYINRWRKYENVCREDY